MSKQSPMPELTSPTNAIEVPLSLLFVDETNVRHDAEPDDQIPMLAASIRHVGLLQPLVVIQREDRFGVSAGRRRLLALQLAFEDRPDYPVSCLEIHADDAIEASLAENYARKAMSTRELYHAFKAMGEVAPAEIAEAFGMDEKRVARILRLANLHPDIMEAWDRGDITEATAQAFGATDDQDIQLLVWQRLASYQRHPSTIRSEIRMLVVGEVDQRLLGYVGKDAYVAAGGTFEQDLFTDEVTIKDGVLLAKLAGDKIELDKARFEQSISRADNDQLNLSWVNERPPYNWNLEVKLEQYYETEADALRVAEIDGHLDNYDQELNELAFDEDYDLADNGLLTDEARESFVDVGTDVDRIEELLNLRRPLVEEKAALEAKIRYRIPEGKGAIVAFPVIRGNEFEVEMQYADYEAAGLEPPKAGSSGVSSGSSSTIEDSPAVKEKKALGASRNGYMALQVMFADQVAAVLVDAADSPVEFTSMSGLDSFLFLMARSIGLGINSLYDKAAGYPRITTPERGGKAISDLIGTKKTLREQLDDGSEPGVGWIDCKDEVQAWDSYFAWMNAKATNRAALGAALLSHCWSPLATNFREELRPKVICLVSELAGAVAEDSVGWADGVDKGKAIELMSHKARIETMRSWGIDASNIAHLKKGTSAAFMLDVLTSQDKRKMLGIADLETSAAIDSWVPSPLALPVNERPKPPEPVAEDKPKKKGGSKKKAKAELEPAD